jgi:hypothetical protein
MKENKPQDTQAVNKRIAYWLEYFNYRVKKTEKSLHENETCKEKSKN